MTIDVILHGQAIPIDKAVFTTLLDNSVAGTYRAYEKTLAKGSISFTELVELAGHGDIPYPLFFAPLPLVKSQVEAKIRKLLAGLSRDTFQVGSREKVELRDVEMIVKDLIRKQELLKRHDRTLPKNEVVGLLSRVGKTPDADASKLMTTIGLNQEAMRGCRNKQQAQDLLIERLESSLVLVSRSVQHHMPQRLHGVRFSGLTIRDNKVPFIFLAGGDHGDQQEPVGRTTFTLALMAVLVARKIFKPVTWDAQSAETNLGREYDIAGAMLMPTARMQELRPLSLDNMKSAAEEFKVTPSAVTVRAMRLGQIDKETALAHMAQLREEFGGIKKPTGMNQIRPENAVRKYAGRELTRRMLDVMDSGGIAPKEFCRAVCLNYISVHQINDLRRAVR